MATWVNDDGLAIDFGVDEGEKGNVAGFRTNGQLREVEVLLRFGDLPAVADGVVILSDKYALPAGAFIESVKLNIPSTTWDSTSDTATWNLGTIDADDRTSNGVTGALIVDATQTEMNAGGTNVAGWVGSQVGTVLSQAKLLTVEINTNAVTAGEATAIVSFRMPKTESDTLVYAKS